MIENNNNPNVLKLKNNMLFLGFIIFSIICSFFCLIYASGTDKSSIVLLPICYAIMSFFLYKTRKRINNNIAITLIDSLFFVRMAIIPFLYSLNINSQLFESKLNVCDNFQNACLLMVYEFIAVQLTIYFHLILKKKRIVNSNVKKCANHKVSDFLVIILALFIVVCYLFFYSYIPTFKTIFSLGDYEFTIGSDVPAYSIGSFGRIISTLFSFSFLLFRILLPAYIIHELQVKEFKYTLFVLAIFCFLQFLFITSTFAETIITCLCLVLYYLKLYPKKRKQILMLLLISTVGIFFLYFIVRFHVKSNMNMYDKDNPITYISQMTNAYFTGIDNVSATFNVSPLHKSETLRADIIGAIPFNSSIFKNRGNKFEYYYNKYNKSYGQIPPTIGVGYYFFGIFLAPILSVLFTKLSLFYYDRANKIKASFYYVALIYCSIIFALGIVMYNTSITLILYFGCGIPMLLISRFSDRKRSS